MSLSTHPPPSPLPPSHPPPPHPHPPPRASTLFNDGVTIIYSYLDTRSWNSIAQTSRHWFQIAVKSGRCECRTVHRLKIPHERSSDFSIQQSLIDKVEEEGKSQVMKSRNIVTRFFRRLFSKKSRVRSAWSLHAHYQTHFMCSLNAIPRLITNMPIRTPTIDLKIELGQNNQPHDDVIFRAAVDAKSINFPSVLQTISIIGLYPGQYTMPNLVPFISTAIHPTKSSLTSLTLRVSPLVSLAPICLHPSLQVTLRQLHLSFESIACKQSTIAEILQMISRMILLTHLTTSALAPSMDTLSLMPTMTDLQQWQVDMNEINSDLLREYARIAPLLESVPCAYNPKIQPCINLASYSGFSQLRAIHFNFIPALPGELPEGKSEQEAKIVDALSALALPLESLHFAFWNLFEVSSWRALSRSLPRLSSLTFQDLTQDPLLPLIQLAHQMIQEGDLFVASLTASSFSASSSSQNDCLTLRLVSLTCDACLGMDDNTFFSSPHATSRLFPQLRSVHFARCSFPAASITPEFISIQFNTSLFLPRLQRFRYYQHTHYPWVDMDYNEEREGEQPRCRFDMGVEILEPVYVAITRAKVVPPRTPSLHRPLLIIEPTI